MMVERAEELLSIATQNEIPHYSIYATFFRAWAMGAAGRGDDGIAEMRRSISDPVVAEASVRLPLLTVLAEICGKNARAEEGLDLVTEGLATAEQTGELHRVKGELLMIKDPGDVAEAQRCLWTAIDIARRQGAKFFELRATVSLARLLASQGHRDEARAMLADIYGWFTEGFDTADLRDAKALLDELGA
jgi:adenylate cyclase